MTSLLAATVAALPACKAKSPPDQTESETAPATKPDSGEAGYGPDVGPEIYEDLVRATREYHVFSDQTWENLGITWEDQLPRLEEEFKSVKDRADLLRALNHFANSLHNPHCHYGTPDKASYLTPGFVIEVEWIEDEPRFYVAEIQDPGLEERIQPGDTLVSYRGVDAPDFLMTFHFESNGNHWRSIARDVAAFLSRQSPHRHGSPGKDEWGFRRSGSEKVVLVEAQWKKAEGAGHRGEFGLDYDPDSCADLPDRDYGSGYAIDQVGANYCVYTTSEGPGRAYPVVRQFSFSYSPKNGFSSLKADHGNLQEFLGGLAGARGVILDLRDNRGGRNPNWFLDWWAPPTPYKSHVVYMRLHEDLDTVEKLEQARITGFGPPHFESYLTSLAGKPPGEEFMQGRPFFCPTPDCENFDNVYHPANQVTDLPVAVLVGPRCVSSCDDVVRTFREYDLGPVVGTAGSAGFTIKRLQHAVPHPTSGEDLGFVALAFSYETSGKTGERLEAVVVEPHHVVEPTFENRSRYDALLVETAIEAFGTFTFPEPE
jgi:hypothetical protein